MTDVFAALLKGEAVPWSAFRMAPKEFLRACSEQKLTGLIGEHARTLLPEQCDWPREVCEALDSAARAQTASELLREQELVSVLDALANEGIRPILMKGTALAYSLYNSPIARPRLDTDLLIPRSDVTPARRVMTASGYAAPAYCEGDLIFCQFPVQKTDEFGLCHIFDFHWKISTQSVFADVLVFDEIAAAAMDLPALGVHARTTGLIHALLLACIHPAMHHRNEESLIWTYDVHLLASRLSETDFETFAGLAVAKQVSAICAHQLDAAHRWFGTRIPDAVVMTLGVDRAREPSAAYLRPDRRWGDELRSSFWGLPCWSDRLRLVREVVFPGPAYMLKAYHLAPSALGAVLLPVLYLHRLASGSWKVLAGQK